MFLNVRAFFACVFRGEGKKGYFYKAQGKRVQKKRTHPLGDLPISFRIARLCLVSLCWNACPFTSTIG